MPDDGALYATAGIDTFSDVFDPWDFIELPGLDSANVHSDLLGVAPAASSPSPSSTPAPAALVTPPSEITANAMAAYETARRTGPVVRTHHRHQPQPLSLSCG